MLSSTARLFLCPHQTALPRHRQVWIVQAHVVYMPIARAPSHADTMQVTVIVNTKSTAQPCGPSFGLPIERQAFEAGLRRVYKGKKHGLCIAMVVQRCFLIPVQRSVECKLAWQPEAIFRHQLGYDSNIPVAV